jgi:HAD superfamily phosphatase (TIGR01681 family)
MPVWTVFDLDNTLILNPPVGFTPISPDQEDEQLMPYQDTERALRFLNERGVIVTLASFRTNAEQVLRRYHLRDYFAAIRYTTDRTADTRTKTQMIQELAQQLNLSIHEAVFFDDFPANVRECTDNLIHTVHVDPKIGVSLELLFDSLYAALRPPFYVMSSRDLPVEEVTNYLSEYRVTFLDCAASADSAWIVIRKDPRATVMLVPAASTIELFHRSTHVRVVYPDLYECLDAAVAQLQRELADIPSSLGDLVRQR